VVVLVEGDLLVELLVPVFWAIAAPMGPAINIVANSKDRDFEIISASFRTSRLDIPTATSR
jgi:hypothetical protein